MNCATATYGESFAGAIRREFMPLRNAAKLLARQSGASPRAAKNWLTGERSPNINSLIPLLAANDKLLAELIAMVEAHRESGR